MRITVLFSIIFLFSSVYGQKNKKYDLRWKLNADEVLAYQTVMNEVDTNKVHWNFSSFSNSINSGDEKPFGNRDLMRQMNDYIDEVELVTYLYPGKNDMINIVMKAIAKDSLTDSSLKNLGSESVVANVMSQTIEMSDGVMLRGSVYESGAISSFWVKSAQKNLIAMFFELPNEPVSINEEWSLELNFVANDQGFECDTSSKLNKVKLKEVKKENGKSIAVLEYDIVEYVNGVFHMPAMLANGEPERPTMMLFRHQAIAEFNMTDGRWKSYEGVSLLEATGIMNAYTQKKFSLIPVVNK